MKYLIDFKNIISRQLPKMPKEYIVRLVFDRNHECLLILKSSQKVNLNKKLKILKFPFPDCLS